MLADPLSWTTAVLALAPRAIHLHCESDRRGATLQRCQRCDIPLGSDLCPNPLCREPHGQRAGNLCTWCYQNSEDIRHGIDVMRLHDRACAILQ
jgi:hypothetical protein